MVDDFVLVLNQLKYLGDVLIGLEKLSQNHAALYLLRKLFEIPLCCKGLNILKSLRQIWELAQTINT